MKLTCVTATFNVIAAGNRERLIRCVESVAAIPVEHEHLVYDGASTDGTVELLRELEARIPTLKVVSEPDTGIYNALNKGVRDANGEWFYVLGCDDYIVSRQQIVNAIEAGAEKGVDVVVSPVVFPSDSNHMESWSYKLFMCGMPYPHQGTLMRTRLVRKYGGFDERYRLAADLDLFQRIILSGVRLHWINKAYTCFSLDGASYRDPRAMKEHRDVAQARFGLSSSEAIAVFPKRIVPYRIIFQHLFNKSAYVRAAARYQLCRKIADSFGLIGASGQIISKKPWGCL